MPWPPSGCLWRGAGYMPASPNSLTHGRDLAQATGQPAERPEARPSRNWPSPEPSSQRFHAPDGSARIKNIETSDVAQAVYHLIEKPRNHVVVRHARIA